MQQIALAILFLFPRQDSAEETFRKFEARYRNAEFIQVQWQGSSKLSGRKALSPDSTFTGTAAFGRGERFLLDMENKSLNVLRIVVRSDGETTKKTRTMKLDSPGATPIPIGKPQVEKTKISARDIMEASFFRTGFATWIRTGPVLAPGKAVTIKEFEGVERGKEILTISYKVNLRKRPHDCPRNREFQCSHCERINVKLTLNAETLSPIRRISTWSAFEGGKNTVVETYRNLSTDPIPDRLFKHTD